MSYEVIEISNPKVACDGGGGALGHPRVFLHVDPDKGDSVVCGYCSRTYVYRPAVTSAA
jgi:uncharacterized Zn-finger protein